MPVRCASLLLLLCVVLPSYSPGLQHSTDVPEPVRLVIAGLVHPHVNTFIRQVQARNDVRIVGFYEPDGDIRQAYARRYGYSSDLFSAELPNLLDRTSPGAVAVFTSTFDHQKVVETVAPRGVPVMMEKPLAVSLAHARSIQRVASRWNVPIIVNYDTTWYPSNRAIRAYFGDSSAITTVRKMVALDGHRGPKEISSSPESIVWLTDPEQNGAGALYDFGCYGANLMTWLMNNERPATITALLHQNKPALYPRVDDEATIVLQYTKAQGIIQASWNWPFSRKDFEVYGEKSLAIAKGRDFVVTRSFGESEKALTPVALPADESDPVAYLLAVARGRRHPDGPSSLENNLIVTEILEYARESARTGKTIRVPPK